MDRVILQFKAPPVKRRCVELYGHATPFTPKIVESKRRFKRHPKHRNLNFN
jgi:hypothetical protein